MQPNPIVDAALAEFAWAAGGALVGLPLVIAALALLAQGRRIPAGAQVLGVAVVPAAVVAGSLVALRGPDAYEAALAASILRLVGALAIVPVCGTLLLGTGLLGLRAPREGRLPAVIGLLVAATCATALVSGSLGANPVAGMFRAGVYGGLGALVALSAVHAGDRSSLGSAGLAWALVVGAWEGGNRGLIAALALQATVSGVEVSLREEGITRMLAIVEGGMSWSWLTVLLAAVTAIVCVGAGARASEGRAAHVAGLLWLLMPPIAMTVGIPDAPALIAAAQVGPPPTSVGGVPVR